MSSDPSNRPPPLPLRRQESTPAPLSLSYVPARSLARERMPAVLTATGVMSICWSFVSFGLALFVFVFIFAVFANARLPSRTAPAPGAAGRPAEAAAAMPYDGDPIGPEGLKAAQRRAVLAAPGLADLTADQREMLDRFLADAGAAAFGPAPGEEALRGVEVRAGTTAPPLGGVGRFPVAAIRTPRGTITLRAASASLDPADGGPARTMDHNAFTNAAGVRCWSSASLREALAAWRNEAARLRREQERERQVLDRRRRRQDQPPLPPLPPPMNAAQAAAWVERIRRRTLHHVARRSRIGNGKEAGTHLGSVG